MNRNSPTQAPLFDAARITATIENALASAGLRTDSGPLHGVTETVRRALAAVGGRARADGDTSVIDVVAREVSGRSTTPVPRDRTPRGEPAAPGEFVRREFTNHAGTRAYKLYVPASKTGTPMPLLVMLHGCTQSPDDFAAGTRMNRLAEQHGFLVVYPEQTANANGSKCWNWFRSQDQGRDGGEPSIIAGIVREIAATHEVDARRIFVGGLSAGAAMAVILGENYPDLFAAVGAHSGLPFAAAHDMPSAFGAMRGASSGVTKASRAPEAGVRARIKPTPFVPTIVFHGDQDKTVAQGNGAAIVTQALEAYAASALEPMTSVTQTGVASQGRSFSRATHVDPKGQPRVESWVLHGAGHAWAGGDPSGSYTDPKGPDASGEMVRFFLAQPATGPA